MHAQPAQLHRHIGAGGQRLYGAAPRTEHLLAPAGVIAHAQHAADMVEHDIGFWKGPRQVSQVVDLVEVVPAIKAQPQRRQLGETASQILVQQQARRQHPPGGADVGVRVPDAGLADAPEAPLAGFQVGLQHAFHRRTLAQIRVADNAGAHPPAGGGGHALGEYGFAHRAQRLVAIAVVPFGTLHEHRGAHVVAGGQVALDVIAQVARARRVPKMVVRVDDGPLRFQNRLLVQGQPVEVRGGQDHPAGGGGRRIAAH